VTRVLLVDSDPRILRALRIDLTARQYQIQTATTATQALQAASAWRPDIVLLDLGLPDSGDGVDVILGLRVITPCPIIVLSGRAGSGDKVQALDAGADDYVTKPFNLDELLARIRALTRRAAGPEHAPNPDRLRIGQYTIELDNHAVYSATGHPIHLTRTEWRLLEILAGNPGKLISHRQLLTEAWGEQYHQHNHYLRQYMAQLRRKLETDPVHPTHLLTEPGMGYRLVPGDDSPIC
jgi:two-component system KDP operon response regulator KdpE